MNTPTTARITSTSENTNPKFTAHISLRCETQKTLLGRSQPSTCEILSQAQRPRLRYVIRGLTSMLPNSQFACACGARAEDCDAGLDYERCLLPGRPTQPVVRCCLKGRPILAFLRALVGAFKAAKLSPRRTLVSVGGLWDLTTVMGEKPLGERSLALAASRHWR